MSLRDALEVHAQMLGQVGAAPKGFTFTSIYDYFVKLGRYPVSVEPSKAFRRHLWECVRSIGPEMKQCFANSQKLALHFPEEFTYWEGYVASDRLPIPIHHGWVIAREDGQDVLVDPTLKYDFQKRYSARNILIGLTTDREYFGVPFTREQVMSRWRNTGEAGSLVDNYREDFPLLKG